MNNVFDAYAGYYDLLYQDKDYEAEVEYVCDLLEKQGIKGGSILELGCGTGKHAEYFAKKGYTIHGIDLSPRMVELANKNKAENLEQQLCFELGDVRTYRNGKKYDAVISLFHVASYQTTNKDLDDFLNVASLHLKEGGVLIFDFWHGPGVITEKPTVRVKRMNMDGFSVVRIAEPIMECEQNQVKVHYTIMTEEKSCDRHQQFVEEHSVRYFFIPEIEKFLSNANMDLRVCHPWMQYKSLNYNDWLGVVCALKR
jgi:SAM-dependent methyltransferase